ncbi:MAG TPA: STAS domain-containing protein [Terracidiphilus sp.]|nr:STAS domain-containing protein [Terracidiphilus sp.]
MSHTASPHPFTFEVERKGNEALLHCHGRLVAGQTKALQEGVAPLIPACKRIVLDLTDVKMVDSMGLGTLVRLYVSCKSAGCRFELINLGKQIRDLLGVTHLLSVLTSIGESGIAMRF